MSRSLSWRWAHRTMTVAVPMAIFGALLHPTPVGAVEFNDYAAINEAANEVRSTVGASVTKNVDSINPNTGTYYTMAPGQNYTLTAEGTYNYDYGKAGFLADAECSISPKDGVWRARRLTDANGTDLQDVMTGQYGKLGNAFDWVPIEPFTTAEGEAACSSIHKYQASFTPIKGPEVKVYVHDPYGNNVGLLRVTASRPVFQVPRSWEGVEPYSCGKRVGREPHVGDGSMAGEIGHADMTLDTWADVMRFHASQRDANGNYIYPVWYETGHWGMYTCEWAVPGSVYKIRVSGTWQYDTAVPAPLAMADAKCTTGYTDPAWVPNRYPVDPTHAGLPSDYMDLYINNHWVDWQPEDPDLAGCSRTHTYTLTFSQGYAAPIRIQPYDLQYQENDNRGLLNVTIDRLTSPAPSEGLLVPPPVENVQYLKDLVIDFAQELGGFAGAGADQQIAALPEPVASTVRQLLGDLLACHRASSEAIQKATSTEEALAGRISPDAVAEISSCAARLDSRAQGARAVLESLVLENRNSIPRLDIWPVIRLEPSEAANTYENDYALIIDLGGNDSYFNNAGGNLLDVKRGPAGSGALQEAPAVGCQTIQGLIRGDCVVSSALVLDLRGNDTYGRFEAPDEDARFTSPLSPTAISCTTNPLVRRIVTAGAGLLGAGMLVDGQGADTYQGKTITLGSGHAGGVGMLRDHGASSDSYTGIRNAMGTGLVASASGLLWDEGGNDSYSNYMPSGGVVSDKSVCDSIPRNLMGAGNIGGASGTLRDLGGEDRYVGPNESMGYGANGGYGTLWDTGGSDAYSGSAGRSNNTSIAPSGDSTGMFVDEG